MEAIIEQITLQRIIIVLLVLSFLWILKLLFKKEYEHLFRALIIIIILGVALIYTQQNGEGKFSLTRLKNLIFPEKTPHYTYYVEKGTKEGFQCIQYVFKNPMPRLSLSMDSRGKYLHISNVAPINKVLGFLNLPKVSSKVPELASITGSQLDTNHYRWDNYPEGTLLLERTLCHDIRKVETYHCISSISIISRYQYN